MSLGLNDVVVVTLADLQYKDLFNISKVFVLSELMSIRKRPEGLSNARTLKR
jgi:hypothetical protein